MTDQFGAVDVNGTPEVEANCSAENTILPPEGLARKTMDAQDIQSPISGASSSLGKTGSLLKRSLEPPSKVRVTASDSQTPSYIAPPTDVIGSSDTTDSLNRSGANQRNPLTGTLVSPPLPSLKKMEQERDNPFRPDDELYHEVDPIVETYKKHPFPHGEDSADSAQNSPKKESGEKSPKTSTKWKFGGKKKDKQNGSAVEETPIKPSHIDLQLSAAPDGVNAGGQALVAEGQKATLTSPKAGKVELVHLEEKKRKCGCCSIQ